MTNLQLKLAAFGEVPITRSNNIPITRHSIIAQFHEI